MSRRLLSVLMIGAVLRILYVYRFEPFLHWDEAPQAYMAQQIAAGQILPLVHFQLPYIGAVEQYPLALLMLILGDGVSTVKIFYLFISLISLALACLLYRDLFPEKWDCLALAFFALCPPILIHFSLQGWSFSSLMFFEVFILWLLLSPRVNLNSSAYLSLLGFLSGLALYNNVLIVGVLGFVVWYIYSLSSSRSSSRNLGIYLIGFIVGYLPMLYFNLVNDLLSYKFLIAKFLGISQAMVAALGPFRALLQGVANKIIGKGPETDFGYFLSFPRFDTTTESCLEFVAFISFLAAITMAIASLSPRLRDKPEVQLLRLPARVTRVLLLVILLQFVVSTSPVRYMVALMPLIPILLCQGLAICRNFGKHLMVLGALVMFSYLLVGHFKVLTVENPDPLAPVFQILEKHHLVNGYGSYQFQSYAAFMSRGRIKISPQIGPVYMDKIPSFSQDVDRADDVFYILPEGFSLEYLDKNHVHYASERVGGWIVIWNLSKRIFPIELLSPQELARPDGFMRWSYKENPLVLNVYRGGH